MTNSIPPAGSPSPSKLTHEDQLSQLLKTVLKQASTNTAPGGKGTTPEVEILNKLLPQTLALCGEKDLLKAWNNQPLSDQLRFMQAIDSLIEQSKRPQYEACLASLNQRIAQQKPSKDWCGACTLPGSTPG